MGGSNVCSFQSGFPYQITVGKSIAYSELYEDQTQTDFNRVVHDGKLGGNRRRGAQTNTYIRTYINSQRYIWPRNPLLFDEQHGIHASSGARCSCSGNIGFRYYQRL